MTAPTALAPPRAATTAATTAATATNTATWRAAWRASLVVHPANAGHADLYGALRAGLTVLLALAAAAVVGHPELAGFAALGAIASVYGRLADPVARIRLVGAAGLLQVLVIASTSAVAWCLATAGHTTLAAWVVPVLVGLLSWLACAACAWFRTGPPGATLLVFAAAAGLGGAPTGADVARRGTAALVGAVLAVLVVLAVGARAAARRRRSGLPLAPSVPAVRDWHLAAARTGLGATVAAVAAQALGLGHAGWAAVGATAVLQGASRHHVAVRALHRGAGTAVGALLAWAVLDARLSFWVLAIVIAALQVVTEMLVMRHYGIAMLTITPMALLMVSLGGAVDAGTLSGQRAFDTLLGVVVGVLAASVRLKKVADAASPSAS